jgi:hypothetical protein
MDSTAEEASVGERPAWVIRLLLIALSAVVALNLWNFAVEQRGDRRLRARRATDLESLAARSPSRAVRHRHGTYYRLARELEGVTLHMDRQMADRHRWALEGLGDMRIRIARRPLVQLARKDAQPIIDAATFSGKLENRPIDLLVEPAAREYVMSWIGKGEKARILIAPRARFEAAKGKL